MASGGERGPEMGTRTVVPCTYLDQAASKVVVEKFRRSVPYWSGRMGGGERVLSFEPSWIPAPRCHAGARANDYHRPVYLPPGLSVPDTHELESRIRIRWHKPMRGGLYGAAVPFVVPFVHRTPVESADPRDEIGETRAQRDLSTHPVNIDALLALSYDRRCGHIDCRIPFRTLANWNESRIAPPPHRTAPRTTPQWPRKISFFEEPIDSVSR